MMDKIYKHKEVEERIYKVWEDGGYFRPENSSGEKTFCVLMPPPNANAPLHCGHATYAIQDLTARYHRMRGFKTLYLPGTDHAGFETQVVYERKLKKDGKSRFDFDRRTLYNDILAFVEQNSDLAINQLKRIGMSGDWSRNTFMLDDRVIDIVYDTFIKMHNDGLVYRDVYMVNYSPHHGTTFSNLETTHKETASPLYYVKYKLRNDPTYIVVATVRPETIYADAAVAVNPEDSRYGKLIGGVVVNPLNDREMPIIADAHVDMEFGTGALKVTPGHDFNDFEIGRRHNLPVISVIDLEGRMTDGAAGVEGVPVAAARVKTAEILRDKGALEKIDDSYAHSLLVDYKDEKPIEPMLLPNWFVKTRGLADKAIEAIEAGKVRYNKTTWKEQTLNWLRDIRDWPISRQLVFGIRIPVWYKAADNPYLRVIFIDAGDNKREGRLSESLQNFTLDEINAGLQRIIAPVNAKYIVSKISPGDDYIQETDTFDTWFSSGQWPLTTLHYPDGGDFKTFYPTDFMDSMWDILFFWIARMVMFGLYMAGEVPFKLVYIHGRVDDEFGKKMSKSVGNVIDPIEMVEKYGADALRMGILVGGNTAAKTTSFSEAKVKGYRNFANKIWNMGRFISQCSPESRGEAERPLAEDEAILVGLDNLVKTVDANMEKLKFRDAGEAIYHFMWDELADKYIESVKSRHSESALADEESNEAPHASGGVTLNGLTRAYFTCLKLLHPFMPFVTEEIWRQLRYLHGEEKPLIVSEWPRPRKTPKPL